MKKLLYATFVVFAVIYFSEAEDTSQKLEHRLRKKRSLMNYGRWCGPTNTPIGKPGCSCSTGKDTCMQKYPPKDALDGACVDHDFCSHCSPLAGKSLFRFCQCERAVYNDAKQAKCQSLHCWLYKSALKTVFKHIPCVCGSQLVDDFRDCSYI